MMKRLYISDLDGTLFNSDAEVSVRSAEIINSLIDRGMYFAFATARSAYSAVRLTSSLKLNVPCILMNGVSVYDTQKKIYIKNNFFRRDSAQEVKDIFERHSVGCFQYKIHNGQLMAHFNDKTPELLLQFAEERRVKFGQPFYKCNEFAVDDEIIYFTTTGEYEMLLPVKTEVDRTENIDCAFYEDTYTKKYYLEVFSAEASKANGIRFLRRNYGFEHVTAFGDNLNDLSMFGVADECVAVSNARPEVRAAADFTALSNDDDGVALWLNNNF